MPEDLVSLRYTADDVSEALDCHTRRLARGVRRKMRPVLRTALLALVAAIGAEFGFAATAGASSRALTGAGSTLVAPLESEWATGFAAANPGNRVSFLPLGSGAGIQYLARGLVDFGATDAPPSAMGGVQCSGCALVPWALSATGIGYNIGGVGAGLKLTGKVLAGIYLGEISNWDNRQISKLNPGVHLPNLKITPIFRSDTSGDSFAFTGYLSAVSSAWTARNRAATIYFPGSVGVPEKGNTGMAGAIRSIKGAIGYVSASYLLTMRITTARLQNAGGNYEYPNPKNIENAAAEIKGVPAGNALRIVDPPKKYTAAYPISTFSYALVHTTGNANGSLLKRWLTYCVTSGRLAGFGLDFVPIPNVVQAAALKTIGSIS
jgi:phosphate transport system substrate-binding protein